MNFAIGCTRQEVKQGSRWFRGGISKSVFSSCLRRANLLQPVSWQHLSWRRGLGEWWGHSVHGPWLDMGGKTHIDGRGCCALTGNRRTWLLKQIECMGQWWYVGESTDFYFCGKEHYLILVWPTQLSPKLRNDTWGVQLLHWKRILGTQERRMTVLWTKTAKTRILCLTSFMLLIP